MTMFWGLPYTKHPYEVDGRVWWLSKDGIFVYDDDSPTFSPLLDADVLDVVAGSADPYGRDLSQHGGSIRIEDEPQRLISKGGGDAGV